jgi:hypothetical protein
MGAGIIQKDSECDTCESEWPETWKVLPVGAGWRPAAGKEEGKGSPSGPVPFSSG